MTKHIQTLDFDSSRPPSPFMNESHHAWRRELRKFVEREMMPFVDEWDEKGEIPLELYKKASDFGLLRMGYPEEYGGIKEGLDRFHGIVTSEELGAHRRGRRQREPHGARHRPAADPRHRN